MIKNALLLFFICAAVFAFFIPSYLKMQALNEKNNAYDKKLTEIERENASIGDERGKLQDDPDYLEEVARKKMGIIRDDEAIYKVVAPGGKSLEGGDPDVTAGLLKKSTEILAEAIDPFPEEFLEDEAIASKTPTLTAVKTKTTAKPKAKTQSKTTKTKASATKTSSKK